MLPPQVPARAVVIWLPVSLYARAAEIKVVIMDNISAGRYRLIHSRTFSFMGFLSDIFSRQFARRGPSQFCAHLSGRAVTSCKRSIRCLKKVRASCFTRVFKMNNKGGAFIHFAGHGNVPAHGFYLVVDHEQAKPFAVLALVKPLV